MVDMNEGEKDGSIIDMSDEEFRMRYPKGLVGEVVRLTKEMNDPLGLLTRLRKKNEPNEQYHKHYQDAKFEEIWK